MNEKIQKIREAYLKGNLKTRSVSPEGNVEWKKILVAHRHEVPWEPLCEIITEKGSFKVTEGHRVFVSPTEKKEAGEICVGDSLLSVQNEKAISNLVLDTRKEKPRNFVFDLTVAEYHNFQLFNSKVIISNSPDRNYHFRPPEHEGVIQNFNKVFGYIWEDYELLEYLQRGLDWWNMQAPETEYLCTLEDLVRLKPAWKTAVLWAAMVHALTALSINWISEEFSIDYHEKVQLKLPDGELIDVKIGELYEICKEE